MWCAARLRLRSLRFCARVGGAGVLGDGGGCVNICCHSDDARASVVAMCGGVTYGGIILMVNCGVVVVCCEGACGEVTVCACCAGVCCEVKALASFTAGSTAPG